MNSKITKIAVISVTENSKIYLNYWEKGKKPKKLEISKICSKIKAAMALELSEDENFLYIGGCDDLNIEAGRPTLSAVSFDEALMEVASFELHESSMKNIFSMKRLKDEEVLVVSGFKMLSLVEFRDRSTFFELKQLRGLHSSEIFDFEMRGKEIFSVSTCDSYIHKF